MCAVLGKANTKADLMLEGPRQVSGWVGEEC